MGTGNAYFYQDFTTTLDYFYRYRIETEIKIEDYWRYRLYDKMVNMYILCTYCIPAFGLG